MMEVEEAQKFQEEIEEHEHHQFAVNEILLDKKDCPVQRVIVYHDRAEIVREIRLRLKAGTHSVVIHGFSPKIIGHSMHITGGRGNSTILEVSDKLAYLKSGTGEEYKRLKQELDKLQRESRQLTEAVTRLEKRNLWLETFANNITQQKGDSNLNVDHVEKIRQFMEFYELELSKIDQFKANLSDDLNATNQKISKIGEEINHAQYQTHQPSHEVKLLLSVPREGENTFELSYHVLGAKWNAEYDIRVNEFETENNVELTYYGFISNTTEEDWQDVTLSLSTAIPSIGGFPPKLPVSTISIMEAPVSPTAIPQREAAHTSPYIITTYPVGPPLGHAVTLTTEESGVAGNVHYSHTELDLAPTSFTFHIPLAVTIPADGNAHKVTVAVFNLASKMSYLALPCVTPNVYLKAIANNTSDYPILPGNVNVFMNNNFISTSHLKGIGLNEEFTVYLGIDNGIKAALKMSRKFKESQGFVAKSQIEHVSRTITIKNTKPVEVQLTVVDQFPYSNDERVKIRLIEPELKKYDFVRLNAVNNLEWNVSLGQGKTMNLSNNYTIEWPANKEIRIAVSEHSLGLGLGR